MTEMRLQKFLARAGVASRRHAEELIAAGRVTVNGARVTEMGVKVNPAADAVAVDAEGPPPPRGAGRGRQVGVRLGEDERRALAF